MALDWLYFALLATLAYSIVDLLEKRLIITRFNSPLMIAIFLALFYPLHLITIVAIWSIDLNPFPAIVSFASGVGMAFAYLLFMRSLMLEELSRVSILGYIHPIFVVFLALILLDEVLSIENYVGIVLLTISTIAISYKGNAKISKALIPMLLLNLAIAVESIVAKFILNYTDYWNYIFWFMLGLIIIRISLLANSSIRIRFKSIRFDKHLISYGFAISLAFLAAKLAFYYSLSLYSVSIIVAITATQPMMILALVFIVNRILFNFVEEDLSSQALIAKILAALLVIFGIYLVTI